MKRVLFVDVADGSPAAFWWRNAARVWAGSFDIVAECYSPEDVYQYLASRLSDGLEHAQLWGHGFPGHPLIGGKPLDVQRPEWGRARGASFWFRSCNVAQGVRGRQFMAGLAQWGISPVAHLSKVGGVFLSQSYLVGVRAGAKPWWSPDVAVDGSAPWLPRTVPVTQMTLPAWAFEHGRGL